MKPRSKRFLTIVAAWVTWFIGSQAIVVGWGVAFYPSPVGTPHALGPYRVWSIGFSFLAATLLLMWRAQRLSKGVNLAPFVFGYLFVGAELAFCAIGVVELVRYFLTGTFFFSPL
jgi:hypothetical protein